jgi:hypothetical protein
VLAVPMLAFDMPATQLLAAAEQVRGAQAS